jgi:uncharacterized protein involved in outer membrane biogenesis
MRVRSFVKVGVVLAAVAAVAAVGLVIAVKSMNLDRIKEMLTTQVQSATGRTLTIAGPLELRPSLVPSVVAKGVTLSNPPGSMRPEMVKIDSFEMEVALQPLLKRQILITRLILSSPDILIETDAKGPGNLDFSASAAAPKAEPKEGAAFSLDFVEVKIKNGKVAWHDRTSKKTETAAIQELTLRRDKTDPALLTVRLETKALNHTIELSGTMGGVAAALAGKPWPLNLNALVDGQNLHVEGSVAELAAFKGLNFKASTHGPELMDAIRAAGLSKPEMPQSLGPYAITARLSDADKQLQLTDVDVQAGKREVLLLSAKGGVKDLTGAIAVDLAVNLESDNPASLSKMVGAEIPIEGPVQLAGQLTGGGKTWKMTALKSVVGASDLAGDVAVQLNNRPHLSGKVAAATLNVADFTGQTTSPAQPAAQSAKGKGRDGRLFSDQPLPFAPLRAFDADLSLQVGKLAVDDRQVTDLSLTLQLNNGRLTVKPFRFGLAGGVFEGDLHLDAAGKTPTLALHVNARQFELGKLNSGGPISGGKSDLKVELKSSGGSVRALMAGATGETSLSVGEGRLQNKAMDWAAGDLLVQVLGAINPLAKSEDSTQMTCAAVRFVIRDGVATTDKGLAMRTAKVDVVGSGTVDLRSEQLDLGIKPRPRGGVGLSLSSPLAGLVRVNGTLAKPSMGIDAGGTLKTAASVGAGVATGGLSTLGELLLDKVAADEDPCRTALGQAQQAQAKPKAEPQKSKSGNLLQGIFGR